MTSLQSVSDGSTNVKKPERVLLKIPDSILNVVNLGSKRGCDGKAADPRVRKSLLDLPNEILHLIYSNLTTEIPFPEDARDDIAGSICLALTCKKLAGVAILRGTKNPVSGPRWQDFVATSVLMERLETGWNRNSELRMCQLSGRFALQTFWPVMSRDNNPYFEQADLRLLNGLEDVEPAQPLCRPCLQTKSKVLELVRTWLKDCISWDGNELSFHRDDGSTDWKLWKKAMEKVKKSEEAEGRKVYFREWREF
ncbi:MAG: hypothetical protein Q9160_007606 [Pyrenula sp. 1 TL-2023]